MRRTARAATAVLGVAGLVLSSGGALSAGQAATTGGLAATARYSVFSPNGDGVMDRDRVVVDVARRAKLLVTIKTSAGTRVRGPVSLGTVPAGRYGFTWEGRRNDGKRVRDGVFRAYISARFTASGRTARVTTNLRVDTHYRAGTVSTRYATIYPRSTTVHDRTLLTNRVNETSSVRVLTVRDSAGTLVFRKAIGSTTTRRHSTSWDGRDSDGNPLPPGRYTARWSGRDGVGNRGRTTALTVRVSGKVLTYQSRQLTVSPQETYTPAVCSTDPQAPQGCTDPEVQPCGTVQPSGRFTETGALSYRSGATCRSAEYWFAYGRHALELQDHPIRGYGEMSVSLYGGPTAPGSSDQAELTVHQPDGTALTTSTGPDTGDHVTTSASVPVQSILPGTPYSTDLAVWELVTRDGASYDVASYTVTYDFLAPTD